MDETKDSFPEPVSKVYRRPAKKEPDNNSSVLVDRFIKDAAFTKLKSSGWQEDLAVVDLLAKLGKGKSVQEESFTGLVFSGATLRKPCMPKCDFTGSKFICTDMRDGDFNHSNFSDTDLTGANLAGANLSYCDFTGANLSGTNFENANLTGAKIDIVTFSEDTGFDGVIGEAKIQKNIDKIMSLQESAERGEIDLRSLGIVDLRKLDLRSINLKGVYLKDKDLKGRLSGVNLSGTIINESDILGADVNMLHFWLRDTNEYNNAMDDKAAQKRQENIVKAEKQINAEEELLQQKNIQSEQEKANKNQNEENISLLSQKHSKIPKAKVRIKQTKAKIIS